MINAEFEQKRTIIARAPHNADLVEFITELAKEKDVKSGVFTAIGALKKVKLGYYDQNSHEYREIEADCPCEMASCIGNISLKDGKPFVHAHAILADENGETKGGHLLGGTVFAAEVHIQVLRGSIERKHDEVTDLSLWELR